MTARLNAPGAPPHPDRLFVGDLIVEITDQAPARLSDGGVGRPRLLRQIDVGAASVPSDVRGASALLIYADRFDQGDLALLRRRRWCGIDRTGQVIVSGSKWCVSVTNSATRQRGIDADDARIERVRGVELEVGGAPRGAASLRQIQAILDSGQSTWTPGSLADAAATTAATTSRFLNGLKALGLAGSEREGRRHLFHIRDHRLLAEWAGEDLDLKVRRENTRTAYLRARAPEEVARRVAAGLAGAGIDAVLTGTAAAAATLPVVTSIPIVTLRVDPESDLDAALDVLGAVDGERGANLRLIADRGRLGLHGSGVSPWGPCAGPTRVWLDLRSEPRGDDAARRYFDEVLDPRWITS